jgi:hypothetical protein
MRRTAIGLFQTLFIAAVLLFSSGANAQAAQQATAAAKTTPPPAAARDLSGVWNQKRVPGLNRANSWGKEDPALTPWGEAQFKTTKNSNGGDFTLDETDDPVITKCLPPGVPRIYLQPFPMQIAQTPGEVIFLYEYDHTVRHVYIDGRKHPADVIPSYMGHSIGHWEGNDTLVVDTVGFNDATWLDRIGHKHSDQLHVIERFKRLDRDNLQIDISMEDPKAIAEPWTGQLFYTLHSDWSILEQNCADNASFLGFEK